MKGLLGERVAMAGKVEAKFNCCQFPVKTTHVSAVNASSVWKRYHQILVDLKKIIICCTQALVFDHRAKLNIKIQILLCIFIQTVINKTCQLGLSLVNQHF